MVCSNDEAENRVKDLFLTFNMPANMQYAKNLKTLFIKYDKVVYKKALKSFMLEIYPKSLPNLGMLKRHLDNARLELQNQKNMGELKTLQSVSGEKSQWRKFLKTVLHYWGKVNNNEMSLDDYHRNMAKHFEGQKDFEGRDLHLKQIRSK